MRRDKPWSGASAEVGGWLMVEHPVPWGVRDRWVFNGPNGEEYRQDSKHETALRRFAHLAITGEWNRLTRESYGVPADVDELWRSLLAEYAELPERTDKPMTKGPLRRVKL